VASPRGHGFGASWMRSRLTRWVRAVQQRRTFCRSLRQLHDALAKTPIDGRYWIRAGLLLGWAREGRVLRHDVDDADFGFLAGDRDRLLASLDALVAGGFKQWRAYRNNAGRVTEISLTKGGARFEFIETSDKGSVFEYFLYVPHLDPPGELRCEIPRHGFASILFLGRHWVKPEPHEPYLETLYGNWQIPDPSYSYLNAGSIVERSIWTGSHRWLEPGEA
jgi:hypothetical protein